MPISSCVPDPASTSTCAPPDPHPRPAQIPPPPLACDTHAHIIGDPAQYPLVASRSYTPPPASVASYRHLLQTLGLQRAVIVQPSFYGTDNRCTRDALRQSGGAWRGVAVVSEDVSPEELAALSADGFCGARINLLFAGGVSLNAMEAIARRVAGFGWHLQLLMDIRELPAVADRIAALPCPVVFDHLGHFPADEGLTSAGFTALQRLMERGSTWVKLSGGYRLSRQAPPYADLAAYAQRLCAQRPDRLVWGSDWPHTAMHGDMPNDGALLDSLTHWVPDVTLRERILVDNPAALYGFP